jgi:hypothetical protein
MCGRNIEKARTTARRWSLDEGSENAILTSLACSTMGPQSIELFHQAGCQNHTLTSGSACPTSSTCRTLNRLTSASYAGVLCVVSSVG